MSALIRAIVPCLAAVAVAVAAPAALATRQAPSHTCARCAWSPPARERVARVKNVDQLRREIRDARDNTTILLADGDYRLPEMLDISARGTVLRSASGDPSRVTLRGESITEGKVGVAVSVSAPDVTVADVTIRDVGFHGVQVRGERAANGFVLHNTTLSDTGQQLLKVSAGTGPPYAENGTVACSRFEYTTHAPSSYTDGVDIISGGGWVVRDSQFSRIRGPRERRWSAGPAILAWGGSQDTIIERNVILESSRGIALGLAGTRKLVRPTPCRPNRSPSWNYSKQRRHQHESVGRRRDRSQRCS